MDRGPVNRHAPLFHDLMLESIRQTPWDSAILLSGGIDSATLLAASLELGRTPQLITVNLGTEWSADTQTASQMARAHNLPHHVVQVDDSEVYRERLIRRTIAICATPIRESRGHEKTHVEVAATLLDALEFAGRYGHRTLLQGMAAGDAYGDSRHAHVRRSEMGEEGARAYRAPMLDDPYDVTLTDRTALYLAAVFGVKLIDPYRLDPLRSWLRDTTMDQFHLERPKSVALDAFPAFWDAHPEWVRKHANMHLDDASGTTAWPDGFRGWYADLVNTGLNATGAKSPVVIYRALLKQAHPLSYADETF